MLPRWRPDTPPTTQKYRIKDLVVFRNGTWSVGRDTGSNSVFVPTTIGPFPVTHFDAEGNVIETFAEPAVTKGAGTCPRT